MRQIHDFANRHLGCNGNRFTNDATFEFLDRQDFASLLLDRHAFMDDPDTAFLSQSDRKSRLGHGVHGGGQHWDIESDLAC